MLYHLVFPFVLYALSLQLLMYSPRPAGSSEWSRLLGSKKDKELRLSIDEQRDDGALGIALFFFPFLSASSDPFVRNFFVRTEPLAESNPVPQDPISAIHPPCIYAGDVASAMGFGLCRSKMNFRWVQWDHRLRGQRGLAK